MKIILFILLALLGLYLLALKSRRRHPGWDKLLGWSYAHRGLHDEERPENSMAAFRAALDAGYGIELDLHLLADGNLGVMHDASLKRTAGADVKMEALTTPELKNYRLCGTEETIPEFRQVLELFDGKAPLIIELKAEQGNHAVLCEATCNMLDGYNGPYCIESFDPRCVYWLKKHRPDIIRGQLSENYLRNPKCALPKWLQFILANNLLNFLNQPDFIAYHFGTRKTLSNTLCRRVWGIQGVTWTLRNREDFDTAAREGWIPIFENIRP